VLSIKNLTMQYPNAALPALSDFNLELAAGEFVSLLGASGCGKTTALRIVGGLLQQVSGDVYVDGTLSTGPSRNKAMVFQHFNLLPWRTALNNVAYGLELQGMRKAERLSIAMEYLELVGLGAKKDMYPSQLSGGQNQRLGLARALSIKPKLLLMDEPFGALDALTRESLQIMLQKICANTDIAVLFVTHSIDEAIFLSDRVLVMTTPGHVIKEAPVDLKKPRADYNWRDSEEYTSLRADIWEVLESEASLQNEALSTQAVATQAR
jgi:NitT/TauT family transport system ATP-binding protein